ncbi:MAG: hypothetical protein RMM08_12480, partial [Armatimonadota bacterium]|nr:hypothetical protein [Armatimonadota bacterium]
KNLVGSLQGDASLALSMTKGQRWRGALRRDRSKPNGSAEASPPEPATKIPENPHRYQFDNSLTA